MENLRKPAWFSPDVEFDPTGKVQLGWAREGAAAYRASHPEIYGVTGSVTKSVTSLKSVTDRVTSVTSERHSVTESVTKKEKTAERTRRWREKKKGEAQE